MVLVHDDSPRISWKLAAVEELLKGKDGLIWAANIRTAHGKTNRPTARLIPLEVASDSTGGSDNDTHLMSKGPDNSATEEAGRPKRRATERGRDRVRCWAKELGGAPKDVTDFIYIYYLT